MGLKFSNTDGLENFSSETQITTSISSKKYFGPLNCVFYWQAMKL